MRVDASQVQRKSHQETNKYAVVEIIYEFVYVCMRTRVITTTRDTMTAAAAALTTATTFTIVSITITMIITVVATSFVALLYSKGQYLLS